MDVVFCRNVLMYFTPETQHRVLENIYHCLVDGGWLIVSPAEACLITHKHLLPVNRPGVVLFRKDAASTRPVFDFDAATLGAAVRRQPTPAAPALKLPRPPVVAPNNSTSDPRPARPSWLDSLSAAVEGTSVPSVEPVPVPPEPPKPDPASRNVSSTECEALFLPDRPSDDAFAPYLEGMELFDEGLYAEAAKKFFAILELDFGQEDGSEYRPVSSGQILCKSGRAH